MRDVLRRLRAAVRHVLGRGRDDMARRFEEESAWHIEQLTVRHVAAGMEPAAARRAALLEFGGSERFGESVRDEVRSRPLDEFARDVGFSLRMMRRTPAFSVAAVLTLALGIGATTVIFSVADHVVLRPLDYPHAERLVLVREVIEQAKHEIPSLGANAGHYLAWRERCASCEEVAAMLPMQLTLRDDEGDPERIHVARASANMLPLLGARTQLGRLFTAAEDDFAADRVVVLTDAFWRTRFGADRGIIGRTVNLGGPPTQVIGVLEPGSVLPRGRDIGAAGESTTRADVVVPLSLSPQERSSPGAFNYGVIVRLRPDATEERVQAEFAGFAREFSESHPGGMDFSALVLPLREHMVGPARQPLLLLLAAVAALLAIMCVNIANLLIARNAARRLESAVRVALGAARTRLVRQAITESLVLAVVGGVLGVLLSRFGLALLLQLAPATLPRLDEVVLDLRVLAVAFLVSVTAGVLFGVLPALRFGATDPGDAFRAGGGRTSTEGRRAVHARDVLVAAQVGLSTLLLIATGLFLGSLMRVLQVDKGFEAAPALAMDLALQPLYFPDAQARLLYYQAVQERLGALPGVTHVALASALPLEGDAQVDALSFEFDERPVAERPTAGVRWVSASFFDAAGMRVTRGRAFDEALDRGRSVVVLSARAAAALWPGEDPIGRRLWPGSNDTIAEVVGIVDDVRTASLEADGMATAYIPHWQNPQAAMTLLVRADDAAAVSGAVRAELRALNSNVPVSKLRTMDDIVSSAVAARRFQVLLLALFAGCALLTAGIGIYGVMLQGVRRRAAEIGVRMALGAAPGAVQRLLLRQGLVPVAAGLVAGFAAAAALGGGLRALLFDVAPHDPVTFAVVAALMLTVAAAVCWLPARRATRQDVVQALRR